MPNVPTPHNEAREGEIAPFVLMPGDPLRAEKLADNYLSDVKRFNTVRNMFGYTGTYKGERISVMGSGMGIPSIGIYSYELYHFYNVETIVRIGTAGALSPDVDVRDIVLGEGACTDSNYAQQFRAPGTLALYLNAMRARKKALTILTISDKPATGESLSAQERQESLTRMMEIALTLATDG